MPVEPTAPNSFAFAPNLTPVTFNDPPPMVDAPPCESILFPPPEDCTSTRRPGHSKKKPENHIPRPPNAFILFRSSFIKSQHVSTEVETNHSTLSKIIGLTWQNLPHEERQVWHAKAKAALEEHKRKFPQYAFRPLHTKGKAPEKRKVREVGPKDLKRCAKIAELLVEGKKGQELDAAIQEFDRHHVPEVITRFEAPLTARMYRRSSSVPVPEPQQRQPFLPSSPSAPSRRVRASSSQPTRHSSPALCERKEKDIQHSIVETQPSIMYASQPSSPAFSFPSKPDQSFNFDSFSFDNIASMAHSGMFTDGSNTPALSVDTSFVDDWTRCSSPTSSMPATPQSFADSPYDIHTPIDACSPFSPGYSLDAFSHESISPFDTNMHLYSGDCAASFAPHGMNAPFVQSDFAAFAFEHPKPELAQLDLDFSAFMATLPPYTL
jgi:hypothetical protein